MASFFYHYSFSQRKFCCNKMDNMFCRYLWRDITDCLHSYVEKSKKMTTNSVIISLKELEEIHGDEVISPKKAFHEFVKFLSQKFNLSETEVTKIDPVAMGSFPQEWLAEKNVFWLLQNDDCSDVFYRHYHARYFHESYVYIIYCNSSDNFYSNCALLQLYLTIQRGIDLEDIAGKTPAYKDMINSIYLYHEDLSFMTATDLSEE